MNKTSLFLLSAVMFGAFSGGVFASEGEETPSDFLAKLERYASYVCAARDCQAAQPRDHMSSGWEIRSKACRTENLNLKLILNKVGKKVVAASSTGMSTDLERKKANISFIDEILLRGSCLLWQLLDNKSRYSSFSFLMKHFNDRVRIGCGDYVARTKSILSSEEWSSDMKLEVVKSLSCLEERPGVEDCRRLPKRSKSVLRDC